MNFLWCQQRFFLPLITTLTLGAEYLIFTPPNNTQNCKQYQCEVKEKAEQHTLHFPVSPLYKTENKTHGLLCKMNITHNSSIGLLQEMAHSCAKVKKLRKQPLDIDAHVLKYINMMYSPMMPFPITVNVSLMSAVPHDR